MTSWYENDLVQYYPLGEGNGEWKRTQVTNCELLVQLYQLQVQIHEFRVQIHELQAQIHALQVQIHNLWVQILKIGD